MLPVRPAQMPARIRGNMKRHFAQPDMPLTVLPNEARLMFRSYAVAVDEGQFVHTP